MKLSAYKRVVSEELAGDKVAVRVHNRLYCSPAINSLLSGATTGEVELIGRYLEILDVEESPYFKNSAAQKQLAKLVLEGEQIN